jgi:hypothetical protein
LLLGINRSITQMVERDLNLTREETEQVVKDIGQIPEIAISVNKTLERMESEQPQSNFTAQRQAVDDINELKDDMNIVTGSIISLNNKVDELFFLENKTPIRPPSNTSNIQ